MTLGQKVLSESFSVQLPEYVPLMVVHDPPGINHSFIHLQSPWGGGGGGGGGRGGGGGTVTTACINFPYMHCPGSFSQEEQALLRTRIRK